MGKIKKMDEKEIPTDQEMQDWFIGVASEMADMLDEFWVKKVGTGDWIEFWKVEQFILAVVSNADKLMLELADDHQERSDAMRKNMISVLMEHLGHDMHSVIEEKKRQAKADESFRKGLKALATLMAEAEAEHATKN